MSEKETIFSYVPISFTVGVPQPTWYAMEPLVGLGQETTGSYDIVTPLSITLPDTTDLLETATLFIDPETSS